MWYIYIPWMVWGWFFAFEVGNHLMSRFLVIDLLVFFPLLILSKTWYLQAVLEKESRPCRTALLRGHCKMKMGWVWCHLDCLSRLSAPKAATPTRYVFFVPGKCLRPCHDGEVALSKIKSVKWLPSRMHVWYIYSPTIVQLGSWSGTCRYYIPTWEPSVWCIDNNQPVP